MQKIGKLLCSLLLFATIDSSTTIGYAPHVGLSISSDGISVNGGLKDITFNQLPEGMSFYFDLGMQYTWDKPTMFTDKLLEATKNKNRLQMLAKAFDKKETKEYRKSTHNFLLYQEKQKYLPQMIKNHDEYEKLYNAQMSDPQINVTPYNWHGNILYLEDQASKKRIANIMPNNILLRKKLCYKQKIYAKKQELTNYVVQSMPAKQLAEIQQGLKIPLRPIGFQEISLNKKQFTEIKDKVLKNHTAKDLLFTPINKYHKIKELYFGEDRYILPQSITMHMYDLNTPINTELILYLRALGINNTMTINDPQKIEALRKTSNKIEKFQTKAELEAELEESYKQHKVEEYNKSCHTLLKKFHEKNLKKWYHKFKIKLNTGVNYSLYQKNNFNVLCFADTNLAAPINYAIQPKVAENYTYTPDILAAFNDMLNIGITAKYKIHANESIAIEVALKTKTKIIGIIEAFILNKAEVKYKKNTIPEYKQTIFHKGMIIEAKAKKDSIFTTIRKCAEVALEAKVLFHI